MGFFGTDGVRGKANVYPMTCDVMQKLGIAVASVLGGGKSPKIIIGKDTRLSGYMFESALASGIVSAGGRVLLTGPLPTPGIAFLTASMRCDAGLVISASHNPYQDNGVKIFGRDGFKLPGREQDAIEKFIESENWQRSLSPADKIGGAKRVDDAVGRYVVRCKSALPKHMTLDGLKVVIDTANGAAYKSAPLVFKELGADVVLLNSSPNGRNINHECGALHPEALAKSVVENGAAIGVALDGDADRLILVDEKGSVVDGDEIIAIAAKALLEQGALPQKKVVATVMSNIGLEQGLSSMGVSLVRTAVGDRHVVAKMREESIVLGGEQSGHLIFLEHGTTGDGIVAALQAASMMIDSGRPLSELRRVMTKSPQVLVNVVVESKPPIDSMPKVVSRISEIENLLGQTGRVLVRYSGTEPKARVMIEGPDESQILTWATELSELLKKAAAE